MSSGSGLHEWNQMAREIFDLVDRARMARACGEQMLDRELTWRRREDRLDGIVLGP